jgi:hypothetical protein
MQRAPTSAPARHELQVKSQVTVPSGNTSPVVRASVPLTIAIDAGAQIEQVRATVKAAPPDTVKITEVAEIRDLGGGASAIVDFGRMRTVTGVQVSGAKITGVFAWQGAEFARDAVVEGTDDKLEFSDLLTERLRVDGVSSAALKSKGKVTLPTAPADLELVVDGKRVWFQPGEAKKRGVGVTPGAGDYFVAEIDITEAVAAAARTIAARGGGAASAAVAVELRCATSGVLSLEVEKRLARVHRVEFPGPQQTIALDSEGAAVLELPLPGAAKTWRITGVSLTAAAKLDALRVEPPIGPTASAAAELVLDLDHPIALAALAAHVGAFGAIAGVRVLARVDAGSAEIGGVLLADAGGAPGAPLPGGELLPVAIAAGPRDWRTLLLRRPIAAPAGPLWIALQTAHGAAAIALATAGGEVRRGKVGGPWYGFSRSVAITPRAAVRLIGTAPEGRPIEALEVSIAGGAPQAFTPTSDGRPLNLDVPEPLPPGAVLRLDLVAAAPASFRFQDVDVFYRLNTEQP